MAAEVDLALFLLCEYCSIKSLYEIERKKEFVCFFLVILALTTMH